MEYENLRLKVFVIRGGVCPNGFYGQKKRSQLDQCTVAISNIAMFQDLDIFGVLHQDLLRVGSPSPSDAASGVSWPL